MEKYISVEKEDRMRSWLMGEFEDILSHASEVGSPTNHLGSRQQQDTGQGSSSPFTGGRVLTPTGEPPTCGVSQT